MKAGYINELIEATFSGGSNPTYARNNQSLKVTKLEAGNILTITLDSATTLDFVSIFNYDGTDLQAKVTQTTLGVTTTDFTTSDASGLTYNNYLIDVDNTYTTTVITLENTGSTTSYLGYVYAGIWIDFGCAEALQMFDNSNDNVTIDRTNRTTYDPSYLFQSAQITTKKEVVYETIRTNIRKILKTGYALKRPYLFDEPIPAADEIILGVLSSGRVGYDFFQGTKSTDVFGQVTIEIRGVT